MPSSDVVVQRTPTIRVISSDNSDHLGSNAGQPVTDSRSEAPFRWMTTRVAVREPGGKLSTWSRPPTGLEGRRTLAPSLQSDAGGVRQLRGACDGRRTTWPA